MTPSLPVGFDVRGLTMADLQPVLELIRAHDRVEFGTPEAFEEDLVVEWQRPNFDLSRDAFVVLAPDGRFAAYAAVWERDPHERIDSDGYVHPDFWGLGIGTFVLAHIEDLACRLAAASSNGTEVGAAPAVSLGAIANHSNEASRRLMESRGFGVVRHYLRMQIEMHAPPSAPVWPAGLMLRTYDPATDAVATHEAVEEAFAEHWGHRPRSFDEWAAFTLNRGDFDPSLWYLVLDGDEIAAVCLGTPEMDGGWVRHVATRPAWRRRGLAHNLLLAVFGEFYRRGQPRVALGVDAANTSGALELYRQAGMAVSEQFDYYRKALAP